MQPKLVGMNNDEERRRTAPHAPAEVALTPRDPGTTRALAPLTPTARVRAELALLDRTQPRSLIVARRPQRVMPRGAVTPVRPLGRSLKIVHLAGARDRIDAGRRHSA